MKCPICKSNDLENLLIDESPNDGDSYVYFYCLYGCDSFTMERDAFHKMKNMKFSDSKIKKLIEISLTKVIGVEDIESLDQSA